jgi:hypothetical protein
MSENSQDYAQNLNEIVRSWIRLLFCVGWFHLTDSFIFWSGSGESIILYFGIHYFQTLNKF